MALKVGHGAHAAKLGNVKVTFKAAAYVSAAGMVIASRHLVIEVLGAGMPSVGLIKVENVPNTQPSPKAMKAR